MVEEPALGGGPRGDARSVAAPPPGGARGARESAAGRGSFAAPPSGYARGARESAAGSNAREARESAAGGEAAPARRGVRGGVPSAPSPDASMDGVGSLAAPPLAGAGTIGGGTGMPPPRARPPPLPRPGGGAPMYVDVDAPQGPGNAGGRSCCLCRPGSSAATTCSCPCHDSPAPGSGGGGGAPMDQSANASGGGGLLVASTSAGGGAVGGRSMGAAAARAAARAAVELGRMEADLRRAEDEASARLRREALAASTSSRANISSVAPRGGARGGGSSSSSSFTERALADMRLAIEQGRLLRGSAPSADAPPPLSAAVSGPILIGSSAPSLDSSMVYPQRVPLCAFPSASVRKCLTYVSTILYVLYLYYLRESESHSIPFYRFAGVLEPPSPGLDC